MERTRYMRRLRLEFGITIDELAEAAGVSHQYISGIELGRFPLDMSNSIIEQAFEKVIQQRSEQIQRFAEVYAANRSRLLDFVTEDDYEL